MYAQIIWLKRNLARRPNESAADHVAPRHAADWCGRIGGRGPLARPARRLRGTPVRRYIIVIIIISSSSSSSSSILLEVIWASLVASQPSKFLT